MIKKFILTLFIFVISGIFVTTYADNDCIKSISYNDVVVSIDENGGVFIENSTRAKTKLSRNLFPKYDNNGTIVGTAFEVYYSCLQTFNKYLLVTGNMDQIGAKHFCVYNLEELQGNREVVTEFYKEGICSYSFNEDMQVGVHFDKVVYKAPHYLEFFAQAGDFSTSKDGINYQLDLTNGKIERISILTDGELISEIDLFKDLSKENSRFFQVYQAKVDGWLSGYPDGTIQLEKKVNRAEFAKMLMLAFGEGEGNKTQLSQFSDVKIGEWYVGVLSKAVELGVMHGYVDGKMRPENKITQSEALKMALEMIDVDYERKSEEEEWYEKYVNYVEKRIDTSCGEGDCGYLTFLNSGNINEAMTRGDCIGLISRILELKDYLEESATSAG